MPADDIRKQAITVIAVAQVFARLSVQATVAFRAKCKIFSRHLQKPILKTEKGRFKGL